MTGQIFVFVFKAGIVLLALLLIYKWLLSGDKQPVFNRVLLLSFYLIAPVAVTIMDMHPWTGDAMSIEIPSTGDIEIHIGDNNTAGHAETSGSPLWATAALLTWIAGMAAVCVMTAVCGVRIRRLIKHGERVRYAGHTVVITDNGSVAPFSIRGTIVMSRKDYDEAADVIITHELRHIGRCHWIDLCIARIAIILCWYNPAAWLMADELRAVHEYDADSAVLSSGVDARRYQMLLIKKAVGRSFPAIANSLNHSNLKKRITMMLKSKQSKGRRWRALALAPAIAAVLMAGNIPAVADAMATAGKASLPAVTYSKVTKKAAESKTESGTAQKKRTVTTTTTYNSNTDANTAVQTSTVITVNGETVNIKDNPKFYINGEEASADEMAAIDYRKVTEIKVDQGSDQPTISISLDQKAENKETKVVLPQFPGGEAAMYKWICDNIKYPDTDAAKKIKDTVRTVVRFTVTAEGKITNIELIRSAELPEFNEETLRLAKSLPDFIPARKDGKPIEATYAIPVTYKAM